MAFDWVEQWASLLVMKLARQLVIVRALGMVLETARQRVLLSAVKTEHVLVFEKGLLLA